MPGLRRAGASGVSGTGIHTAMKRRVPRQERVRVAQTSAADTPAVERNALAVLDAWNALGRSFSKSLINSSGRAWAESPWGRLFIAAVPGGFAWPTSEGEGA